MPLRALTCLALCACLAGCAGTRPMPHASQGLGLVIGSLRLQKITLPFPDRNADFLHLVPMSSSGAIDTDHPLVSSLAADGQVYFFNVPPGRYALTGGVYFAHGLRYVFQLRPEQVRQTFVEVRPGEVSFLGSVLVRRQFQGWGKFGMNALKSAARALPPWKRLSTDVEASFRATDRTSFSEVEALRLARARLAGTPWFGPVNDRLAALGGLPPPQVTTGFWRKKAKPVLRAENFSWVDALDWGEPRTIKGGLEWRQPKDQARVAVVFRGEGSEGFQPREDFMRQLKDLGSPEDLHAFSEILIGSMTAHSLLYTKHVYPHPYLTGSVKAVFKTEVSIVPVWDGYFVLYYRAREKYFARWRKTYLEFRSRLDLSRAAKKEEPKFQ